jgi:hypothetical protein
MQPKKNHLSYNQETMNDNTETFDPAKILEEAKDKVAKMFDYRDWDQMQAIVDMPIPERLEEAALLAIASVREECEMRLKQEVDRKHAVNVELKLEIERLNNLVDTMKRGILKGDHLYGNLIFDEETKSPLMKQAEEIERLKAEKEKLQIIHAKTVRLSFNKDTEITELKAELERKDKASVYLQWLIDEKNILSNNASIMLPSELTDKTKRVANALDITIQYIRESKALNPTK